MSQLSAGWQWIQQTKRRRRGNRAINGWLPPAVHPRPRPRGRTAWPSWSRWQRRVASLSSWGRCCGAWYPRSCFDVFGGKLGASCFLLYTFDLLCKGIPSLLYIGLAVVALFIKWGESLFRENRRGVSPHPGVHHTAAKRAGRPPRRALAPLHPHPGISSS
jgi:hypothetical protein